MDQSAFELRRKGGRTLLRFRSGEAEVAVRPVWMRPLSGRGEDIALVDDARRQIARVSSLAELDPASRALAAEELEARYLLPRIERVASIRMRLGIFYWEVETDRGSRQFTQRDPDTTLLRLGPDRLVVCDTSGNRYEIESLLELDPVSRARVEMVL